MKYYVISCFAILIISFQNSKLFSQEFTEIQTGIVGVNSAALSWGDYDNDGDLDLLLCGSDNTRNPISKIYRNDANDVFTEQTDIELYAVDGGDAEWGDYDNDGDLDILITGWGEHEFRIYKNNAPDSSGFSEQSNISLPGINNGSAIWGDYDNDGFLDILISGSRDQGGISAIFKNNGDNSFIEQTGIVLTEIVEARAEWGDYDNDGDLDILICGRKNSDAEPLTKIFRNNGDNTFTEQNHTALGSTVESTVSWGDYNGDGYLDILFAGGRENSRLYRNNGDNTFTELTELSLINVGSGPATSWGDIDADGDLDFIICGSWLSKIYINNGDNTFSELSDISLTGVVESEVSWGDYDNDGDLDLILTGRDTNNDRITKLYKNNSSSKNSKPEPPANLISSIAGNEVILSWNMASDGETSQSGLTYNLYISTTAAGSDIRSPQADISNGYRKIFKRGSINNSSYSVNNLKPGTYYWSIQAIDNCFEGSEFAPEKSFSITFGTSISPAYDQVLMPGDPGNQLTVSETETADSRQWKYSNFPNGPYNFILEGETSTSFTPNFSEFRNYYVVCVSTKDGFSVTSNEVKITLPQFTEQINIPFPDNSSVAWGDYDNDGDLDILLAGNFVEAYTRIYENNGDYSFTERNDITALTDVGYSSLDWGEYNNDEFLDILLTGSTDWPDLSPISKIFYNNQLGDFMEEPLSNLTPVSDGQVAWVDFDKDGDLDFLLTGRDSKNDAYSQIYWNKNPGFIEADIKFREGNCISISDINHDSYPDILIAGNDINDNCHTSIYLNKGNAEFQKLTDIFLEPVHKGSADWGDYDNDGDIDILLTGRSTTGNPVSKLYKNIGENNFIDQTEISLSGLSNGSVAWADFDNDGDLDILLTGGGKSKIYKNQGNSTFEEQTGITLDNVDKSSVAWGDYDNDGDLDILLSGSGDSGSITKIYTNNNTKKNTIPEKPENLQHEIKGKQVTLKWDPSHDIETPDQSLSYNVSVGTSPGKADVVSPMSLESGLRKIPSMGNAYLHNEYVLNNLDTGTYYWKVQAIDNAFLASEFSDEQSFTILPAFTEQIDISLSGVINGLAAWGDYDNDGDLDILLTGKAYENSKDTIVSKIYKNNGPDSIGFTEQSQFALMGIESGNVSWGDYDNDGDLDIILSGFDENFNSLTKIYNNNGAGSFSELSATSFVDISENPSLDWKDIDNDGDLDILLSGRNQYDQSTPVMYINNGPESNSFTQVSVIHYDGATDYDLGDYNNDGIIDVSLKVAGSIYIFTKSDENSFIQRAELLLPLDEGAYIAQGDFDNDADLDILLTGADHNNVNILSILRNDGSYEFTDIETDIRKVGNGSSAWGDYNNDGYLDVLIAGQSGNRITKVYRNNQDGTFSEELGIDLPGVLFCSVSWGDYDNDGDLDFIVCGQAEGDGFGNPLLTKIYTNNTNYSNSQASAPDNLESSVLGYDMKLSWDKAIDPECTEGNLYYNLRIGSSPGAFDIMAPMANLTNGYRSIPAIGNAYCNTFAIIKNLTPGETYYWSVQAIDQSFKGGEWSEEQSFEMKVVRAEFSSDTVCLENETRFYDESISTANEIIAWKWKFGDGDSSLIQNPFHVYSAADTFNVQLIAFSNDFSDTISKEVIVKPKPQAIFQADPVCHGDPTAFINQSDQNGMLCSYIWDFGDGQVSSLGNPEDHYYAQAGTYSATLKLMANNECMDTLRKDVLVANYPIVIVTTNGPVQICDGDDVLLSVEQNDLYNYQWNLDNIPLSDSTKNHCNAIYNGAYSVDVKNTLAGCVSSSSSVNVDVQLLPAQAYINYSGDTAFCEGDSILLSIPFVEDHSYLWRINGLASGITTNEYIVKNSGIYSVQITNSVGCSVESSNNVELIVFEKPVKALIESAGYSNSDCPKEKLITLSLDQSNSQYAYQWKKDNILIEGETAPMLQNFLESGIYSVSINNNGCITNSDGFRIEYENELLETPQIISEGPVIWYLACSNNSASNYKWYYNDVEIPGANDFLYFAGQNLGKYEVAISLNGSCYSKSLPYWIPKGITDIEEHPFANLKIYPNPTPGLFTIEMDNPIMGELIIDIFGETGQQIINIKFQKETSHFKTQIDLSGQAPALYLINLMLEDWNTSRRLLVE